MSPFELHVLDWKHCTRCSACESRTKVVLTRGDVPCDILFIGEAPGESEDILAVPFVGKAGKYLDGIISRTVDPRWKLLFTNVVGCIPREGNRASQKSEEPSDEMLKACASRVEELILIARPKLIFAVGKYAKEWIGSGLKGAIKVPEGIPVVPINHPSYILRVNIAQRGYILRQCEIQILKSVRKYLGEGDSNATFDSKETRDDSDRT